jgi:hypothetical protein
VALLAVGCHQGSPAGVYIYSRPSVLSKFSPVQAEPVAFILELRANGTYVSTIEGVVRGVPPSVEGDLPCGRGTWEVRDDSVILSSGEAEVGRLLLDGLDLLNLNGGRYTRVRWLSDDQGGEPAPGNFINLAKDKLPPPNSIH